MQHKLAIIVASYLDKSERFLPQPSLRLAANRLLGENDVELVFKTVEKASEFVLDKLG